MALKGTALITGASGGLGAVFARELAARKLHVVLVARSQDKLTALAEDLEAKHQIKAHVYACDLAAPDAVQMLMSQLKADSLAPDVLINNAGFATYGPFAELPFDKECQEMQLNMVTLTELTHKLLPGMLARGYGYILNVSSMVAFAPAPFMATYSGTKAYVLSWGDVLAHELRGSGVHVCTLCPGPVRTDFQVRSGMVGRQGFSQDNPRLKPLFVDAEPVVKQALRALERHKTVCIPGAANRLTAALCRLLPRQVVPPLLKRFQ